MFDDAEPNVPQVSADEVKAAIEERKKVILLDVRTANEYSRGKIMNGINLPVDEVSCKIESVIPDKEATVYVYCLSGSRSVHIVDAMIKLGYKYVFNLTNGLLAWKAKGYPMG
jgi:rhodanese-related sulfurtransferase